MYKSVQDAFYEFSKQFEGEIPFMYLDVKGLVTIGIGNLIEPMSTMPTWLKSQFKHKSTGKAATAAEVEAEWKLVKSLTGLKNTLATKKGSFIDKTDLRIDSAAISRLVSEKLASNERTLKGQSYFKDFDTWPADAQLGLLSMAWAMGPGFAGGWPKFRTACQKQDWDGAAANCTINATGNPGVVRRNEADKLLFSNAAVVKDGASFGFKPEVLYYPQVLLKPIVITPGP